MGKDYKINLDKYGTYPRAGKKSFIKEIDGIEDKNVVVVFFGTQTGTSEEFSTTFTEEITEKYNIQSLLFDIEDYDMSELLELPQYCKCKEKNIAVGFFMSTYGEGEPTDNAIDFWDWIQNCVENYGENDEYPLKEISYFIFGLGNKTYEFYNHIGRELKKALDNWGGSTMLGELGEGNDDEDIENDFQEWKEKIYPIIVEHFSETSSELSNDNKEFVPNYNINYIDTPEVQEKLYIGEISRSGPRRWGCKDKEIYELNKIQEKAEYDIKHPYYGKIKRTRQLYENCYDVYSISNEIKKFESNLTESKYCSIQENKKLKISRECLHFDIDITGSNINYSAGDHVAIFPTNEENMVNELIKILEIEKYSDTFFTLSKNPKSKSNSQLNILTPCTIKTALTYYLDINANLKTRQLEILLNYTVDENEKEYLLNLINEFKTKKEIVEKYQKTILQILKECPNLKVPVEVVLGEILPRIIPRYYSISSSPKINPNILSVTAVVVRYPLTTISSSSSIIDKILYKEGLCTGYLNKLHQNNNMDNEEKMIKNLNNEITKLHPPELIIPISIRESTFKLPRDTSIPIIMIGPGTGIAPFRGFIQERKWQASQGKNVGKTMLFYGCRNRDQDYLYREEIESLCQELQKLKEDGNNGKAKWFDFEVINAFSRETEKKIYVQHRVLEHGPIVWELLREKRAHIYICGDAKNMSKDVHSAIITIAKTVGGMGENQANELIKDLKLRGRFHEDVW